MRNYKKYLLALSILLFFNLESFANEKMDQSIENAELDKQISYALGYDIFSKINETFKIDPEFFIMGAKDNHDKNPKLTEEKLRQVLMSYQQQAREIQMAKLKEESAVNKALGKKFLEENAKKEGVVTLPSGLQYKILTQGDGPLPVATDTVECHYKGSLIDETVFDSSYQRGKPAVFQVGGVIQGWVEALQMMKEGSKWMLYIPSDLAYGDRGAGAVIKPGAALIFEVELLGIVK